MRMCILYLAVIVTAIEIVLHNRRRSKRVYREFCGRIEKNFEEWARMVASIAETRTIDVDKDNILYGSDVFLVTRENGTLKVLPLNTTNRATMSERKYRKLQRDFQKTQTVSGYTFNTVSIYSKMQPPFENDILWVNPPS